MIFLSLMAVGAQPVLAEGCDTVWMQDALIDPPAVIVVGASRGMQPDLFRTKRLLFWLSRKSEVTIALDLLPASAADDYRLHLANGFGDEALPLALDWDEHVGLPWIAYKSLFVNPDIAWIPIGLDLGDKPIDSEPVQIPMALGSVLRKTSGGNLPAQRQETLLRTISWQDSLMAQRAIEGWSGEGYLVVMVDRFRVYGNVGVGWHIPQYTDVPVSSYLLSWAGDECVADDKVFSLLPFVPLPW